MIKICTIVGARPQFIKAAAISRAISGRDDWSQYILHTGQHYDEKLSKVFFDRLDLPKPKYMLELKSSERGPRFDEMKTKIEKVLSKDKPVAVLVYGDTDSTLAGAEVAHELGIKVIHIEAGLRSFDLDMPEEVNRIATDKISDILVAPTRTALQNLESEGIYGALLTGDIMHDNAIYYSKKSLEEKSSKVLMTMHRPSNVDSPDRAAKWIETIGGWCKDNGRRAKFFVHPRTKKSLRIHYGSNWKDALREVGVDAKDPLGYVELLQELKSAALVVTDSGGLQKEAYSLQIPSIVIRHNTEWVELVKAGHAVLCPEPSDFTLRADTQINTIVDTSDNLFGDGKAAEHILDLLESKLHG